MARRARKGKGIAEADDDIDKSARSTTRMARRARRGKGMEGEEGKGEMEEGMTNRP